jgi:hypothetical protein
MSDRATIRYPYRTSAGRLRWGRWTGSRAEAFNAGSEALGGLTAHSLPTHVSDMPVFAGAVLWSYAEPVTKGKWAVSTDDVIMLGAAMIAKLPAAEPAPAPLPGPVKPAELWLRDAVAELKADGVTFTDDEQPQRDVFDELIDAWNVTIKAKPIKDPT